MRGVDTIGQCRARLRQQSTMQVYSVSNRSGDAVDISSSHQRAALAVLIDCTGLPARAGVGGQYELKRCGKGNCRSEERRVGKECRSWWGRDSEEKAYGQVTKKI